MAHSRPRDISEAGHRSNVKRGAAAKARTRSPKSKRQSSDVTNRQHRANAKRGTAARKRFNAAGRLSGKSNNVSGGKDRKGPR